MVCYICGKDFGDNELTIPMNLNVELPFGRFSLVVLSHYLCGLDHFLDSVVGLPHLLERDRILIERKLLTTLTNMAKGSVQ
jgi:hypothetical protein